MVLFLLSIKAEVEGVSSVSLQKDANICISVRNPLSDYETREKVVFGLTETVEQEENSREPPCQFALKWEGSKKRSTLEVVHDPKAALKKKKYKGEQPRNYTAEDSGNWVPILVVECRGMEPFAFHALGDEFVVESEGGVRFDSDVDLSEGDWGEYDEENDAAVSISEFEAKFEPL